MMIAMNRGNLIALFLIVLLCLIIWQVIWILSPFLQPLFWAMILSFAFYPVHVQILRAVRGNRTAAAAFTTLVIFLALVPLVAFLAWSLATESVNLYHGVLAFIQENRHLELLAKIRSLAFVNRLESVAARLGPVHEHTRGWFMGSLKTFGVWAGHQAGHLSREVLLAPFNLFLTFFLVFFFLRDATKINAFFYEAIPLEEKDKRDVIEKITGSFEAVIRGQLLTALVQAVLAGVIFFALGLPLPVLFAALTFVSALIPLLGAPIIWFPFVVYLAFQQAYTKAAVLFFLGAFGISLVDNFLKPILIGEKTKLPYLLLFLGILGGLKVYGLLGVFLAPVVLTLFFALIKIYRERFL
jgi:predicted PurR-regulated permease PerM